MWRAFVIVELSLFVMIKVAGCSHDYHGSSNVWVVSVCFCQAAVGLAAVVAFGPHALATKDSKENEITAQK